MYDLDDYEYDYGEEYPKEEDDRPSYDVPDRYTSMFRDINKHYTSKILLKLLDRGPLTCPTKYFYRPANLTPTKPE